MTANRDRIPLPPADDSPSPSNEVPLYRGNLEADLQVVARCGLAEKIFPVSHPKKLPFPAWGIPAEHCRVGSRLGQREDSVCHERNCYAKKGRFLFPNVQRKLRQAYEGLFHPLHVPAAIFMIRWTASEHWRWFHSGDLQGAPHLRLIIMICQHTRDILHWLPTRERSAVQACKDEIPDNLRIRASGTLIDGPPPRWWPVTATVFTQEPRADSHRCPAETQGNRCGDCRSCFNPEIADVAYPLK